MFRATARLLIGPNPAQRPNNFKHPHIYPISKQERYELTVKASLKRKEKYGRIPLPLNMRDEHVSRTMTRLLRHKAAQEGLPMRPDGYVKVTDLLSINRLHSVDFPTLERIVAHDNKGRYKLIYEPDEGAGGEPIWWIRANQGHSLPDVKIDMVKVTDPSQILMAVHGTTRAAWEKIVLQGLSRMGRHHIHFAQGVATSGVMSGMRTTSQVYIYLDVPMVLEAGFEILLSANGVVLCPGDNNGFIGPEFFSYVTWAGSGEKMKNWTRPEPIPKTRWQEMPPEDQPDNTPAAS